jgi:6-phosphogluconolactonase (cycloisomerase 2 family)
MEAINHSQELLMSQHTSFSRRRSFKLLGVALALVGSLPVTLSAHAMGDEGHEGHDSLRSGKVFSSSNSSSGNELLVFEPGDDGMLHVVARVATQGQGTGGGLGSQGAVTLSRDGRHVFVVNAVSNTVSTFAVREHELVLRSVVNSGGQHPVSVTEHDGMVVVLNAQGEGNVTAFRNEQGMLQAIAGGTRPLSASSGANPAQVGFSSDGDALVVTEKGTNRITTYEVAEHGRIGVPIVTASSGQTPFGFAFDHRDHVIVSEAFGGAANASAASSYALLERYPARPLLVSPSIGTTQTAACWVAVTPNGRYAYTTNAGSGTVSSYRIGRDGRIKLAEAVAANLGAGTSPTDVAASASGHHLYVLNTGGSAINGYTVGHDGSLKADTAVGAMPRGMVGLAAN